MAADAAGGIHAAWIEGRNRLLFDVLFSLVSVALWGFFGLKDRRRTIPLSGDPAG